MSQPTAYRAETMALLQDLRQEVAGQLRITREGQLLPPVTLAVGDWQPVPGFEDAPGVPNFWQRLLAQDFGSTWLRTKGVAGAGGGQAMHIAQASMLYVLRGAILWTAGDESARHMGPGDSVRTPAGGVHRWVFLAETECLVRITPAV
jgi:hypothetical protein